MQRGLVLGVAAGSWEEEQVRESEGLGLSLLIQRLYIIVRIFFLNEQAQTVIISIYKEGYTDEKPRKVPLKETKIQEQKTVQRAAQASHYPPTKLASCLAPAIPVTIQNLEFKWKYEFTKV